jgi:hypothetical protein
VVPERRRIRCSTRPGRPQLIPRHIGVAASQARDLVVRSRGALQVPTLEPFHPGIDRYDRRSAARLFQSLWPDDNVARGVADNLAASIRVAHAAGDACWEVTMYPYGLRLNVGQVEALTLFEDSSRFVFRSPLHLGHDKRFAVDASQSPVYPAVPIPSGVCQVAPTNLVALPAVVRAAHEAYIQAAASSLLSIAAGIVTCIDPNATPDQLQSAADAVQKRAKQRSRESTPRPSVIAVGGETDLIVIEHGAATK